MIKERKPVMKSVKAQNTTTFVAGLLCAATLVAIPVLKVVYYIKK